MKKILFLLMVLIFISCTKDKENTIVEEEKPITMNVKSVEYAYKGGKIPLSHYDPDYYTYKNNKIVNILNYGFNTIVKYIGENQIETESISRNIIDGEIKINSHLSLLDNKIQYTVTESHSKTNPRPLEIQRDSTIFEYKDNYLIKLITYSKKAINSFKGNEKYQKEEIQEIFWKDGNIVKIKIGKDEEYSYTYDNEPYVMYADLAYETTFFVLAHYLIPYGKMGKWNKNNVLTMNKTVKDFIGHDFRKIQYGRELDKHNRVSKVLMRIEYASKESELDGTILEGAAILGYE